MFDMKTQRTFNNPPVCWKCTLHYNLIAFTDSSKLKLCQPDILPCIFIDRDIPAIIQYDTV